ncbi:MAG: EVE domain-containing protein [Pseudomonadota bacterium]
MNYWLMKSEPNAYSIDDLQKDQTTCWEGVRNYQVRNMMRDEMRAGDLAFFYHSNSQPPGIVGIMEIISRAYPDPTAFNPESKYYDPKSQKDKPRWVMVDVKFKQKFASIISLEQLRSITDLNDMPLLRKGNRLSITPVTAKQWHIIASLS